MAEAQTTPPQPTPQPPQQQQTVTGTQDEKTWALFTHLSMFSGIIIPLGTIIGPLVVWLIGREKSPFIDRHGKEALNFGITVTIAGLVAALLMLVLIGFILLPVVLVVWIVFTIIATMKASNGEEYQYPMSIRFVS